MTGKGKWTARAAVILAVCILAAQAFGPAALAGDEGFPRELPGTWTYSRYVDEQDSAQDDPPMTDAAFLTLEEDGTASLRCCGEDGKYLCSFTGVWAAEYVPDLNDRVTLTFTRTDSPSQAGSEYAVECVYEGYMESWVESDTLFTYLILTPVSCSGVSPFEDVFGDDWELALHREQGPNMRVVRCNDFVSLRESRSASSKRLAKVPLGALVLAFPEAGQENGFILCTYHDEYGYILAEYLQPAYE